MNTFELSVLIPARNEMFLAQTVADILEHSEANTEVIVGLDGHWADPGIPDDDRVTLVYYPESIGQRKMTNQLARLSKAKYVIKCDAHCTFDRGFDRKLIEDMQDDWTVVPVMRNLHAFDWLCLKCGSRWYQGPTPTQCLRNTGHPGNGTEVNDCKSTEFKRELVWKPNRHRPQNTSYCFDPEPHFQYNSEYKARQKGDLVESMSLQGSFFMMTRKKYWELNICDEKFGSWGSQGIEVAVKTWLSGGKVICNKKTWYAHMFRTQGGDFSFPYEQKQSKVVEAKSRAREIFFNNNWDKQIHPLSWLVEKFWPVSYWTQEDLDNLKASEKWHSNGNKK
ncbi:MAG: glycosyltransferase [Candidatus Paceibacterota bacterium]